MLPFPLRQVVNEFFDNVQHADDTDYVQVWRELPWGKLKVIRTRIDMRGSNSMMLIEVHEEDDGSFHDISLEINSGPDCYTTYHRKEHLQADPNSLFTLWTVTPRAGGRQVQFPWVQMRQRMLANDSTHQIFGDLAEHVMYSIANILSSPKNANINTNTNT